MQILYEYAYIKGTNKGFFARLDEPATRVMFDQPRHAKNALIRIGNSPGANVPVGQYNLLVTQYTDREPIMLLPYYVQKEVPL